VELLRNVVLRSDEAWKAAEDSVTDFRLVLSLYWSVAQVIAINTLRSIILVDISLNQRDLQCTVCIAALACTSCL